MTQVISLPFANLAEEYQNQHTAIKAQAQKISEAQNYLRVGIVPTHIIGSAQTPALWWVAATRLFPEAKFLLTEQDKLPFTTESAPQPVAVKEPTKEIKPQPQVKTAQPKAQNKPHPSAGTPREWPHLVFLSYVWNKADADKQFTVYMEKAAEHLAEIPNLIYELEKNQRQGKHAVLQAAALEKRIAKGWSKKELQEWIEAQAKTQSNKIIRHLTIELNKHFDELKNKQFKTQVNQGFKPSIPYVELKNGVHPQSIRALQPSQQWQIVIDETGNDFGIEASERNTNDTSLGRIVALAMPKNHKLPDLISHAKDLSDKQVEDILRKIIDSPCGVLGATVQQDLKGYNWMAAVSQLARWAMLMLPIVKGEPTRVKILIENRAPYTERTSLAAWQDNLENELKLIAPERFADVHLTLEIVSKDFEYNGYVDAIANCWGSPTQSKRQILARTRWRDTCLLQNASLERVEDLYRSINSDQTVNAADWFEICGNASNEGPHSLLKDLLIEVGKKAQQESSIWNAYLQEILQRIQTKSFTTHALNEALIWLENYRPEGVELPKNVQLQLGAAQLAAQNHLGLTDVTKAGELLKLAQELKNENAPESCSVALRVAVSATNTFDFSSVTSFIEQWLQEPIAVPGLENHAKLHSTLGQLAAFNNNHKAAIDYFKQALDLFEQLSDPTLKQRNYQQTRIYLAIALLDSHSDLATSEVMEILEQESKRQGIAAIKRIAASGTPSRFEHYLLLRWLVMQPEQTAERETYLAEAEQWQTDAHHPWMLINAYRAWLLAQAGRKEEASGYLQDAIEQCCAQENSAVLVWMGHSLAALGQSLQLETSLPETNQPVGNFKIENLAELARATTDAERLQQLAVLLPFNFH